MYLKTRIATMQFLQFFVWGAWMPCMAAWWFTTKGWDGAQFGAVFATMGIGAMFMPTIVGIIADRWVNAERLYGIFQLCGAVLLFLIPMCPNPHMVFIVMLINMCFYMPTIGLSVTISYASMEKAEMSIVNEYPAIRIWGTIGFIVAMWTVSLLKLEISSAIFYIASFSSLALGIYGFTMPKCPPLGKGTSGSWYNALGLDAFKLFKQYKTAVFLIFSMLLGAILQLSNAYVVQFIHSFSSVVAYQQMLIAKYPAVIVSISQISEVFMILLIPFFLRRFGIRITMLVSLMAWVVRFGLLGFGNPAGGLWMLVLSMIIYGAAFDFFNISGSLYIEMNSHKSIRASAQGLFVFLTNGVGAWLGSFFSGWVISSFYTTGQGINQVQHWQGFGGIWVLFATYALIIGVLFMLFFRYKHNPEAVLVNKSALAQQNDDDTLAQQMKIMDSACQENSV